MIGYILQQLQRIEEQNSKNVSSILYLFLGIGITLLIYAMIVAVKKEQEKRSRPVLVFLDHVTDEMHVFGYYVGKVTFQIPVGNGSVQFWAVQVQYDDGKDYFIIPSHGRYEDMVKTSDIYQGIVIMEGELIGFGDLGPEVHKIWFKRAFPESVYQLDSFGELPPNYILCSPVWSVGIKKEIFRQEVKRIARMFTLVRHITIDNEETVNLILQKFEEFTATTLQTQTNHFLSHWRSVLSEWDALLKQYTTSIFTISRLLHIRSSQVMMSGISHAIQQGSIPAVAEFIRNYKGMIDDVLDGLGLVGLPKDTLELTFQKANQTKEEAIALARENAQLNAQLQSLVSQLRNGNAPTQSNQNEIVM